MKNHKLILVAVAAMVVLYLIFKPQANAIARTTQAVGTSANPNVAPATSVAAGFTSGVSGLFGAIANGLGLGSKSLASALSSANAAPAPTLDPTAQGISDALGEVQASEFEDPIQVAIQNALAVVQDPELLAANDPINQSISDALSSVQDTSSTLNFSTLGSPGLDSTLDPSTVSS